MLAEVDPYNETLLPEESIALIHMIAKREQYVAQGRAREAHGLGTGIWILWTSLTKTFRPSDLTNWGEI